MHDLVDIDAVVVGDHLVVAVPAGVHQDAVLLVLLRVQHVVALLREEEGEEICQYLALQFAHSG